MPIPNRTRQPHKWNSRPSKVLLMVKCNLLSTHSLLVILGAIQSCCLFIPAAAGRSEAADGGQQRASLTVVNLTNDIQLVQVVGPFEGPVVSEEIDQHKQTYV